MAKQKAHFSHQRGPIGGNPLIAPKRKPAPKRAPEMIAFRPLAHELPVPATIPHSPASPPTQSQTSVMATQEAQRYDHSDRVAEKAPVTSQNDTRPRATDLDPSVSTHPEIPQEDSLFNAELAKQASTPIPPKRRPASQSAPKPPTVMMAESRSIPRDESARNATVPKPLPMALPQAQAQASWQWLFPESLVPYTRREQDVDMGPSMSLPVNIPQKYRHFDPRPKQAAAAPKTGPCLLLALPAELRNQIYTEVVAVANCKLHVLPAKYLWLWTGKRQEDIEPRAAVLAPYGCSLSGVCQQTRGETWAMLLEKAITSGIIRAEVVDFEFGYLLDFIRGHDLSSPVESVPWRLRYLEVVLHFNGAKRWEKLQEWCAKCIAVTTDTSQPRAYNLVDIFGRYFYVGYLNTLTKDISTLVMQGRYLWRDLQNSVSHGTEQGEYIFWALTHPQHVTELYEDSEDYGPWRGPSRIGLRPFYPIGRPRHSLKTAPTISSATQAPITSSLRALAEPIIRPSRAAEAISLAAIRSTSAFVAGSFLRPAILYPMHHTKVQPAAASSRRPRITQKEGSKKFTGIGNPFTSLQWLQGVDFGTRRKDEIRTEEHGSVDQSNQSQEVDGGEVDRVNGSDMSGAVAGLTEGIRKLSLY